MWFNIILFLILYSCVISQFERKLEYTIQENQPSGIQVGHISSDIIHSQKNEEMMFFDSSYSFILRDKNEYFQLDSKTSVLKTDKTIDLEILCPKYCNEKGIGFMNLVVNVWKTSQLHGVIHVKIVVIDQNDNAPVFPMKIFEKKIKEVLYGIGKVIELPKAVDRDITYEHNKVTYKLNEQSDTFKLQITNDSNPRLILMKDVDYELETQYLLTLIAWNEQMPNLKTYLEIRIEVIDMNDCEPIFPKGSIQLMLDENSKPGKLIIELHATDKDKDSKLVYGLVPSSKKIYKDTFLVKESGEVILMKELDVEIQQTYVLEVFAADGEFTANAKLTIIVRDVNNHAPVYNLNPASLSIEENQPARILVGQVTVSDVDAAEVNGDIRCKEPQGKSNIQDLIFQPDPAENPTAVKFDMYSRIPLDREEGAVKLIYLICHDGGLHERLTSTMTISLNVLDVNDNPPKFSKQIYTVEIKENNAIGDKVIQVQAIDKDYQENAIITYSILSGPNSNMFFIDQKTGWINVMRELDREEIEQFQLIILATNKPLKHRFTSSTTVKIKITDKNDNRPQLKPPSQFSLIENLKPNTFIGTVNAEDKDSGINGKMIFSLLTTKFDQLFEMKRNGSLYSRVSFDRELQERYCINIRVSDLGLPQSLSVTGTICIVILDANDNTPIILVSSTHVDSIIADQQLQNTSRPQNHDVIVASVYEAAGYKIATISAQDIDKDENAQIKFMIEEIIDDTSSISSLFMIDENDGSIKISRVMSRDYVGEYKIKIIAQDKGKPSLRTEKIIKIKIRDIPPQTSFVQQSNIQVTGNVLIVIILSTISAFLTALLIGAILCMIRPCCQHETNTLDYHQDPLNTNTQTLLQKLPPNYSNVNPYGQFEPYDQSWKQTLIRNGQACVNPTIDSFHNNSLDKIDYLNYESARMYMSQNNLCHIDHVVGKPSGCSCEQGVCIRYSAHNNANCLSPNPEEQCSDSGKGASDDDMKALNGNGNLVSSPRAMTSVYGTYSIGETSSRSPWINPFLSLNSNERRESINEQRIIYDQIQNNFMNPISYGQVSHIPMTTFQSSCNIQPINNSSNLRSDSNDSLSNSLKKSNNNFLSNIPCRNNYQQFSLKNDNDLFKE